MGDRIFLFGPSGVGKPAVLRFVFPDVWFPTTFFVQGGLLLQKYPQRGRFLRRRHYLQKCLENRASVKTER